MHQNLKCYSLEEKKLKFIENGDLSPLDKVYPILNHSNYSISKKQLIYFSEEI
jgi:hypothetical protein